MELDDISTTTVGEDNAGGDGEEGGGFLCFLGDGDSEEGVSECMGKGLDVDDGEDSVVSLVFVGEESGDLLAGVGLEDDFSGGGSVGDGVEEFVPCM